MYASFFLFYQLIINVSFAMLACPDTMKIENDSPIYWILMKTKKSSATAEPRNLRDTDKPHTKWG